MGQVYSLSPPILRCLTRPEGHAALLAYVETAGLEVLSTTLRKLAKVRDHSARSLLHYPDMKTIQNPR